MVCVCICVVLDKSYPYSCGLNLLLSTHEVIIPNSSQKRPCLFFHLLCLMISNSLLLFSTLATNQYSAALHYYLQAGAVCSDFFNKAVPPDVYTDQVNYFCGLSFFPTFTVFFWGSKIFGWIYFFPCMWG